MKILCMEGMVLILDNNWYIEGMVLILDNNWYIEGMVLILYNNYAWYIKGSD